MRPFVRRLLYVGAGSLLLAVLLLETWPQLLENWVRAKVLEQLQSRAEDVALETFHLERDHLEISNLHLERQGLVLELEELEVSFELEWWNAQVLLHEVRGHGGSLSGELSSQELPRESKGSTSSRIVLEDAGGSLRDVELDLIKGDTKLHGILEHADFTKDFARVELSALELQRDGFPSATVARATTSLTRDLYPLEIEIEGGGTHLMVKGEEILVKDVAGTVTISNLERGPLAAELQGMTAGGSGWGLQFFVDLEHPDGAWVTTSLKAEGLRPGLLPVVLPVDPEVGEVFLDVQVNGSPKQLTVEGQVRAHGVRLDESRVARGSVFLDGTLDIEGLVLNLESRTATLERVRLSSTQDPPTMVSLSGSVAYPRDPDLREYSGRLVVEPTSCQALLEAIPAGLAPGLEGFKLEGQASADISLTILMADPQASTLEGGIELGGCKLEEVPPEVAGLSKSFVHIVKMPNGRTVTLRMGPGSFDFAPLETLPVWVSGAVLSTEDGGFWHHDGFLGKQFQASLRRNVELRSFRRGASTITMQMVKNVLLSHEKTLSRKMQELFLTWVVEKRLSKQRIMEIYLNAVEFGPGIYGIQAAARAYFGKEARDLSSLESAFMATLLPRPVERYEMLCRGALTEKHDRYVHQVHRRMLSKGRVSQEEFDAAEAEGIRFRPVSQGPCLEEARRAANGPYVQEAITGLLVERLN